MDIEFDLEFSETIPEFNQEILDGLVYHQMKNPKRWVDQYIRTAEMSFPEGVEYLGSRVVSPQRAYMEMADNKSRFDSVRMVDMSTNDMVLHEYNFSFNGQPLFPKYMYLPSFRKGNRMHIAGKEFTAMSVLIDPGFSVTTDEVFFRVTRAPITFKRVIWSVLKNGERESVYLANAKLHWKGGENDRSRESDSIRVGDVVTTLSHYLFCRLGVQETFRKYADTEIVIKHRNDVTDEDREIYNVFTSRGIAPKALRDQSEYASRYNKSAILLPKDKTNVLTTDLVISMWYIMDHFPDVSDPEELMTPWQWKVWLGSTLWGDQLGYPKLVENIDAHLATLDEYLDTQTKNNLYIEEDLHLEDFYDLLAYMIENINEIIMAKSGNMASMFDKRLVSVQYILKDIIEKIFKCMFELNNPRKREVNANFYNQVFGKYFTASTIMGLRITSQKPFMAIVSSPGDNMHYRGTSRLVMQSNTGSTGKGKSNKVNVDDESNHLNVSWLEGGNYGILPHAYPLAKATVNPLVKLDDRYTIIPKEELKKMREHVLTYLDR